MLWAATGDARFDQNMGLGDMIRLARALPHIAAGANIEIPSTLTNGSIPHAALKPGAGRALQTIGAGGPDCPRASMTDARFS
jgi:hypothetical protein